jgi:hypothetical protein
MNKRRTYWLTDQVTSLQKERAQLLGRKGFDVQFFTTLENLRTEFESRRAGVILVSDDGPKSRIEKFVLSLSNLPDMRSARLLLITTINHPDILTYAAGGNFRDIIPLDLESKQWLQRIVYATASRPIDFIQPSGQITLNNISSVSMPARVVWISDHRIRLECRIKPPVGSTFTLNGPLAEAMGVKAISLKVMETHKDHLRYRFSDGLVAQWNVPEVMKDRAFRVISSIRSQDLGPTCKVFMAVSNSSIRNALLSKFEDPRFEVSIALQKQSIVHEPKFLSPDAIIIEHSFCSGEHESLFEEMLATIDDSMAIIVIGDHSEAMEIKNKYRRFRIFGMPKIPANLTELMFAKYLDASRKIDTNADDDSAHITADNKFSFAAIGFSARLKQIHPTCAHVAVPFEIGKFALCRLESPLITKSLKRHTYLKITDVHHETHPADSNFPYIVQAYFSEMSQKERTIVADSLVSLLAEHLKIADSPVGHDSRSRRETVRSPELGSLKKGSTEPKVAEASEPTPSRTVTKESYDEFEIGDITAREPTFVAEPPPRPAKPTVKIHRPKTAKQKQGTKAKGQHDTFRLVMTFATLAAFIIAMVWAIAVLIAPNWGKSGKSYSDQLKIFAPHLQKQEETENGGN